MRRRANSDGSIYKPKGSRFWWIAYHSGGKRHFESSRSERITDARNLLNEKLGHIRNGVTVTPKVGKLTVAEGLQAVVNDMQMNGKDSVVCGRCGVACCGKEGHSHAIARKVKRITQKFVPEAPMASITTSRLTQYATDRMAEGASGSTVNQELALIRRAFRLALRARELATMPHVPMLKLSNVRKGFFEQAEFDAVVAHLPESLRGPFTLAFYAGWRTKSEVMTLEWSQVDREAKVIRLEVGATKNDEGRVLPYGLLLELATVVDDAWTRHERLQATGVLSPYVFPRADGRPWKDGFYDAWHAATEAAGCPGKIPHDFRRTAARNLVRRGVPEKVAMQVTGHKTRSIFDRYNIVVEKDVAEALAKLSAQPVEEPKRKGQVRRFRPTVKDLLKSPAKTA